MAKVKLYPAEVRRFRMALGFGMLNFGHFVEAGAKRQAPVRGGHRSFLTTKRTKAGASGAVPIGADNGSVLIGGTLRRSIHTAAYVDGQQIARGADENGRAIPDYVPGDGVVVVVGTNCDYGAYVELGTTKMKERPFLGPALDVALRDLPSLVRAGMKAKGY